MSMVESEVEEAALGWLESIGWAVKHGPEIGPGELFAERESYGGASSWWWWSGGEQRSNDFARPPGTDTRGLC